MKFKEYIKLSLSTFRPGKYRKLTAHKQPTIIKTYFASLLCVLVLMIFVAIPALFFLPGSIEQRMNQFEYFDIDINVSADEPLTITKSPLIVLDLTDEPRIKEKEHILMTNDEFAYNRYVWFGQETRTWDSLKSVKENSKSYSAIITALIILLIPSVLVTLFLGLLIESIILVGVAWTLVGLTTRLGGIKIRPGQLFKVCVLALTPFLAFQVILLAYVRWFIIPFILYVLLVVSATWLVGKNKYEKE